MSNLSKKILYVGTQAANGSPLGQRLSAMNLSWSGSFCVTAREALGLLAQEPFDAIVTDERLPDSDGLRFLNLVQERYPGVHRLIVSELTDPKAVLQYAGAAHQCVPKPWEVNTLRESLDRTFTLALWLSNPAVRGLVNRMKRLPSPPDLYFAVVRALRSPEVDLDELYDRAAQDPSMTAKLLQVANSAALGLRHKVTNVGEAISYLGLETTRSLILLSHTFSYCDRSRAAGFRIDRLWQHCFATGILARRIARQEKAPPEVIDECFLAGLLHDIGELLLAVNLPEEYSSVLVRTRPGPHGPAVSLVQAEFEKFGATHADIGAELMAIWNLPLPVVEALALHHRPAAALSMQFSALTAVHVADVFEHELLGNGTIGEAESIDLEYLAALGLERRVDGWREACRHELNIAASDRLQATG